MELDESVLFRTNDGRLAWRRPSGRIVPYTVSGGSDGPADPPPTGTPPSAPGPGSGQTDDRVFTQAQVNDIAAREKSEGKRAALREVAESLGMTVDEAKAALEAAKAAELERMSEADRRIAEANAREAEAKKALEAATAATRAATVQAKLIAAGCPVEQVEMVQRMIDPNLVADADIATGVETLKAQLPQMFQPVKPGAPGYTPPSPPAPAPAPKKDAMAAGRQRALAKLGKTPAQ